MVAAHGGDYTWLVPISPRSVGLRATSLLALYLWAIQLAVATGAAQPAADGSTAARGPITGSLPALRAPDAGAAVAAPTTGPPAAALAPYAVTAATGSAARYDAGAGPAADQPTPLQERAARILEARRARVTPIEPEPERDPVRVELHGPTLVKAGEPVTVETVIAGDPEYRFDSVDYHLTADGIDQSFTEAGPKKTFEDLAVGKYEVTVQLIVGDLDRTASLRFEVQPIRLAAVPRETRPVPPAARVDAPPVALPEPVTPAVVTSVMPASMPPAAITPPPAPEPDWPLWLLAILVAVAATACVTHRQLRGRWLWQSPTVPMTVTLRPLTGSFTSECSGFKISFRLSMRALQDHGTQRITKLDHD